MSSVHDYMMTFQNGPVFGHPVCNVRYPRAL